MDATMTQEKGAEAEVAQPGEAPPPAEGAPGATASLFRQATSSAASFLGNARAKATELLHQGSLRISSEGKERPAGTTTPPAADEGHAGRSAVQMASGLLEAAAGAAAGLTKKTRDNTSAAYQAAVQGLQKLTAPTRRVAAVCKADLRTKPCPQVLLLCCNWVATQGLHSKALFQPWTNAAQVEALAARLEDSLMLLPADLDPGLASAVILHFLASLEEPLLTYKLAPRFVAAGATLSSGAAQPVSGLLEELPLANWSSLKILMDMCYRVASQFNVTGTNALSLAKVLTPVLVWYDHVPGPAGPSRVSQVAHMADMAADMAAASIQAIKSKLAPVTGATEGGVPGAAEGAGAGAEATAAAATEGTPAEESAAATGAAKPRVVLDEDEELLVGDAGAFLDKTVAQQEPPAPKTETDSAGHVRYTLQGEELDSAVLAVEYLILNFDELFVNVA